MLLREKPGIESLDFISPAFRQEVRRQTRNYNHLLWSCANHLVGMLENREFRGPEAQSSAGRLVLRLGSSAFIIDGNSTILSRSSPTIGRAPLLPSPQSPLARFVGRAHSINDL